MISGKISPPTMGEYYDRYFDWFIAVDEVRINLLNWIRSWHVHTHSMPPKYNNIIMKPISRSCPIGVNYLTHSLGIIQLWVLFGSFSIPHLHSIISDRGCSSVVNRSCKDALSGKVKWNSLQFFSLIKSWYQLIGITDRQSQRLIHC